MMLQNPRTGDELPLWQAQEDRSKGEASMDEWSLYGDDSDETLLASFEAAETIDVMGRTTAIRLSNRGDYSSNPIKALAQWATDFLSYVNGAQGSGYYLVSDTRDRSVLGVIDSAAWTRSRGDPYTVEWELRFRRGEGLMVADPPSRPSVTPLSTGTIDGYDLGDVEQLKEEKMQEVEPFPIAFEGVESVDIMESSGAKRTISIVGRKVNNINEFDEYMRSRLGGDDIVQYRGAFPGRPGGIEGMIKNYDSTQKSGVERIREYNLEIVEGVR